MVLYHFGIVSSAMYTIVQGILTEGGRISTVDLLVLTSSDQLLFVLKLYFFTKQPILMRRSTVLSLFPSVRVPCIVYHLMNITMDSPFQTLYHPLQLLLHSFIKQTCKSILRTVHKVQYKFIASRQSLMSTWMLGNSIRWQNSYWWFLGTVQFRYCLIHIRYHYKIMSLLNS